jgi:hypothetical protein
MILFATRVLMLSRATQMLGTAQPYGRWPD